MVCKTLSVIAISSLLILTGVVTVDAKGGYGPRGHRDSYSFIPKRGPVPTRSIPKEYLSNNQTTQKMRAASLGTASVSSGIASTGFAVDRSWMDDQIRPSNVGRTVDWRGTPDIHFGYTDAQTSNANPRYGYNVYSPTLGSWPQGALVGCEVGPSDQFGQWVSMDVDGNGFVILAGGDDVTAVEDNHTYYQKSQYSCFWGAGTVIAPSQYSTGDFFDPTQQLLRPLIEHQVWAGDTITHLLAGEGALTFQGVNLVRGVPMYFRKVGNFELGSWEGPLVIDTTAFTLVGDITASRVSPKVAVSYCHYGVLGIINESRNSGFDIEVYYRESDSVGATGTWSPPINMTNYGAHTEANHIAWIQTHNLYDSEDGLHIVWEGYPVPQNPYDSGNFSWGDFSNSVFHWSDRTGIISRVHNAEWGPAIAGQVCGFGSPGSGYTQFHNISECDGRMYTTFVQYLDFFGNSGFSQIDDCVSSGGRNSANGEIYVAVSTGLDGLLWDAARTISQSYTPDCDSAFGGGVCMNDTRVTVSRYGMDEVAMTNTFGALTWPADALVDVSPGQDYAGGHYLHVFYTEDHWPAPTWRDNSLGRLTENPLKWMRLACVDPITAPQISLNPNSAGFPQQVDHGVEKIITVTVTNDGNTGLTISQITGVENAGPGGWLSVSTASLTVPSGTGNTATFDITINVGGMIDDVGTIVALSGEVYILSDAPSPRDSVSFTITDFIVGPVAELIWDSVSTGSIQLTVASNGDMGSGGIGSANMDYTFDSLDCDPTANVYMFGGSPVIIQKIDSAAGIFKMSTNLFTNGFGPAYAFKPITGQTVPGSFTGPDNSDAMNTGTFVNWDSTVAIEQTFYAPTSGTPNDNFIIVKTVYSSNDGMDHDNLLIGDVIDWDVPSEVGANNTAGIMGNTVYLQGVDTAAAPGCQLYANRFAASTFLGMYNALELSGDMCFNNVNLQGAYASDNTGTNDEAQGSPNGALDSALAWSSGSSLTGQWLLSSDTVDQRINMTYVFDYTLVAGNPLTVYTALTTVLNGTTADLEANVTNAAAWYALNLRNGCDFSSCCVGTTGNVDNDAGVDIADLTYLIDFLFINFPEIACPEEGNVDGDSGIDIADLTFLIDYLFINFPDLPDCP